MSIFNKKQSSRNWSDSDEFEFIDLELDDAEELDVIETDTKAQKHQTQSTTKNTTKSPKNFSYSEELFEFDEDFMEASADDSSDEEFLEDFQDTGDDQRLLNSLLKEKQKSGFLQRFLERFTVLDMVLGGTGVLLVVIAITVVTLLFSNKTSQKQQDSMAQLGSRLSQASTIGESELLVLAQSTETRLAEAEQFAKLSNEQLQAQIQAVSSALDAFEKEQEEEITVKLSFNSVEKDLKIKITNEKTRKLIAGGDFTFEVTDPDGKTTTWNDHDKDGIIYKKELAPGTYRIVMKKIKGYVIPEESQKVTVKDKIVYEQIEIADEIKTEAEIDVAKEDTVIKEPEVAPLVDTVPFLVSASIPRTEANYIYIETTKDKLVDPATLVAKVYGKMSSLYSTITGITLGTASGTVEVTKTITVPMTIEGGTVDTTSGTAIGIVVTDPTIATATVIDDNSIGVKGEKVGSTKITVSHSGKTAEFTVTVEAAKTDPTNPTNPTDPTNPIPEPVILPISAVFSKTTGKILTEATDTVNVTITNYSVDAGLLFKSSDETVATVASVLSEDKKTATLTITGKKAGTANITAMGKVNAADTVLATYAATVVMNPKTDTVSLLVTKENKPVYVYNATTKVYTKATYADYYKADTKFYVVDETQKFFYNGWQTLEGKTYYFLGNGVPVTGEQVIQGAKYAFGSDGVLTSKVGSLGIDVSKWNGSINWTNVKNSGVNYVIIRCGYRGSSQGTLVEDPTYKSNIQGAIAAGLKVGVYFYSQAVNQVEAVEEASMVLNLIRGYKISYPVFIDIEASGGRGDAIDKNTRTAVAQAFCETIQGSGYTAGVYSGKHWFETKMNTSSLEKYKIWVAHYNNAASTTYKGRYDIWQYTSSGTISGIGGNVDLNLSYMGY